MDYIELNKICENIVKKIFEGLPSVKLKIKEDIEQTDSGVIRTFEIEFDKK